MKNNMKIMGIVIGVLISVGLLLTPAVMPAIASGDAQPDSVAIGDPEVSPDASPDTPVPIKEEELPAASAFDYNADTFGMVWGLSIDNFEMPDYKDAFMDKLIDVGNSLNWNQPYNAWDIICNDILPNVEDWMLYDSMDDIGIERMETTLALIARDFVLTGPAEAFYTIDHNGFYKDDYDAFNDVQHYETIRTNIGWQEFWAADTEGVSPPPPAPSVDFSSETVLMAFLGVRNTGGYSIEITEVYEFNGEFTVVLVDRTGPGPGANVPQVITNPGHVISIDKIPKNQPIIFMDIYTNNVIDIIDY